MRLIDSCWLFFALLLGFSLKVAWAGEPIKRYRAQLEPQLYKEYQQMLDGRSAVERAAKLSELNLNRHRAEQLIMQLAVSFSGCRCTLEYSAYPESTSHARTIELIRAGYELTHPVAGFSGDSRLQKGIYLSQPVLLARDFFVGLYTHESRRDILSITDPEQLLSLRYGVGKSWEIDNAILAQLGVPVVQAPSWTSLTSMLIHRRADVVLQPFTQSQQMAYQDESGLLKPVRGFKMPFLQARQYMVSKKHPDGANFLTLLNRGLKALERNGMLRQILIQAGVINQAASGFVDLAGFISAGEGVNEQKRQ